VLWSYGFRPFYLLGSIFGAVSILLWTAQHAGLLPSAYLRGPLWHGHEMLFGFATAVIAGFLLTAVATWTQQPPLRGLPLMALALLWLAGRVLVLTPMSMAAAIATPLFPIAVAAALSVPLIRTGNRRNLVFVALLALLGLMAAGVHLAALGLLRLPPGLGVQVGLDVVLLTIVVVAGRVLPMFTNNGVPGAGATRQPLLEKLAIGSIVLLGVLDLSAWNPLLAALVAASAALAHAARLYLWRPWRTLRTPLVWILHAAYAWIVVHLALRSLAGLGWVSPSLAIHALTIGAIGGMTIGMMTRTARGHTGRSLHAGRPEAAMFVLVQISALVRVAGGILAPQAYLSSVHVSGVLWSTAFALYALFYWKALTSPRADGKPG